jgi:hypothetical protein
MKKGLGTKSTAPCSKLRSRADRSVWAVSTIRGTEVRVEIAASTSKPLRSGSIRSRRTRSKVSRRMRVKPSLPSIATLVEKPALCKPRTRPCTTLGSSSTMRMRGRGSSMGEGTGGWAVRGAQGCIFPDGC